MNRINTLYLLFFTSLIRNLASEEIQTKVNTFFDFSSSAFISSGDTVPFDFSDTLFKVIDSPSAMLATSEVSVSLPVFDGAGKFEFDLNSFEYISDGLFRVEVPVVYLKASAWNMETAIGKYPIKEGLNFSELSSGSLILSGKGPAYPVFYVGTKNFIKIPYSFGILETHFMFSYGVLDDERYVENPFVHSKSLYGKINFPLDVHLSAGLIHAGIWGGVSPVYGKLPSDWDSFWRIFLAEGGGTDSPEGEQINKEGDHRGVWDVALEKNFGLFAVHANYQHFFEDRSGMEFRNGGWIDGLFSIGVTSKGKKLTNNFLYEYYNSTFQSGTGVHNVTGGRDFYYYNYIYTDGWIYSGEPIGTPFIIVSDEGFIHTRVRAHRIGFSGDLTRNVSYKAFVTDARYFGTYADYNAITGIGTDVFENGLNQVSFAMNVNIEELYSIPGFHAALGAGFDFGEAYKDSFGLYLSIGYRGSISNELR